jgi:hypothetical protein
MDSSKNLLLIGLSKPERGSDEEAEDMGHPADDAIDEMFGHLKSGDHKSAREAFKSAVKICMMDNDSDDEMSEESGY